MPPKQGESFKTIDITSVALGGNTLKIHWVHKLHPACLPNPPFVFTKYNPQFIPASTLKIFPEIMRQEVDFRIAPFPIAAGLVIKNFFPSSKGYVTGSMSGFPIMISGKE